MITKNIKYLIAYFLYTNVYCIQNGNKFFNFSLNTFSHLNTIDFYHKHKEPSQGQQQQNNQTITNQNNTQINEKPNNNQINENQNASEQDELDLLNADEILYDKESIVLRGNVYIIFQNKKIKANFLNYIKSTQTLIASGDVQVTDENNNQYSAQTVLLNNKLKEVIIKQLQIYFKNNSHLQSQIAKADNQGNIICDDVYYTACTECIFQKKLTWEITSKKIKTTPKTIQYNDSILKFFGFPILFLPYFEHPKTEVKRHSGFLMPKVTFTNDSGFSFVIPYFFNIANNIDLLIKPIYSFELGPILWLEYGHLFHNGMLFIDASIGLFSNLKHKTNNIYVNKSFDKNQNFTGHIFSNFIFELKNNWVLKGSVNLVSDKIYLRKFPFIDFEDDLLKNYISLDKFSDRNYFNTTFLLSQSLHLQPHYKHNTSILPSIEYETNQDVHDWNYIGNVKASFITFSEHTKQLKLSFDNILKKQIYFDFGTLLECETGLAFILIKNNISSVINSNNFIYKNRFDIFDYEQNINKFNQNNQQTINTTNHTLENISCSDIYQTYAHGQQFRSQFKIIPRINLKLSHPLLITFNKNYNAIFTPFTGVLLVENNLMDNNSYPQNFDFNNNNNNNLQHYNWTENQQLFEKHYNILNRKNFFGNLNRYNNFNELNFNQLNMIDFYDNGDTFSKFSFGFNWNFYQNVYEIFSYSFVCIYNIACNNNNELLNNNYLNKFLMSQQIHDQELDKFLNNKNNKTSNITNEELQTIKTQTYDTILKNKINTNINDQKPIFINCFKININDNLNFKFKSIYSSSNINQQYNKFEYGICYKNNIIENDFFIYHGNIDTSFLFFKDTLHHNLIEKYHGIENIIHCNIKKTLSFDTLINFSSREKNIHKCAIGLTYKNECMKVQVQFLRKRRVFSNDGVNSIYFVVDLKTISDDF